VCCEQLANMGSVSVAGARVDPTRLLLEGEGCEADTSTFLGEGCEESTSGFDAPLDSTTVVRGATRGSLVARDRLPDERR
jgi:hypothetical protein